MQVTDYLYPNDMIAQCEAAIQLLKKENEDIEILQGEILNFTEDELLISEKISKAKAYFYNYHLVFEKLRRANESDIIAFEKLRNIIVDEVHLDLQGDVIFATKQSADFNYECERQKAEYYSKLAVLNSGLPMLSTVLHNYAMGHSMQASYWKQISDDCVEKMNLFDRIEQSTADLFVDKDIDIPTEIIEKDKSIGKVCLNDRYNIDPNDIIIRNIQQDEIKSREMYCDEGAMLFERILKKAGYTEAEIEKIMHKLKESYSSSLSSLYITNCYSNTDFIIIKDYLLEYSDNILKDAVFGEVPLYGQTANNTCGSACGSMILNSMGIEVEEDEFWNYSNSNGQGTYVYRVVTTLNYFIGEDIYKEVQTANFSNEEYYEIIVSSLQNGYPVQVHIKPTEELFGYTVERGHYVIITGVYTDEQGDYIAQINDPYSVLTINNPQKLEINLSDLHQCNKEVSGFIICNGA